MSKESNSASPITAEEPALDEMGILITLRVVAVAMAGGLVGMVLMLPLLAGVPLALDLFQTESIVEFSSFGLYIGLEPSLTTGIVLFLLGGTTVLPLLFLVAGAFLPPEEPRYLRGATYATIFWIGFLFAFWPGGSVLTEALFVVISLVSHWIYGTTLGYVLHSAIGVPQHNV
ncbi:DUF6789 family protein [Halalkalicoccus sp. NIPERK01]|uniref:DUF6789 family protein n=1 Tax=Halalkalicoccus sp. NIPERK01 TaxID=3053469 RepID=UPI00256F1F3B|nr:DUF6789 family protein [Halalkalicoccus sp. NIPERK01]MDL5363783.1 hypothetical protein [Halalkalicoccus sp. NIPERK01]